ncbi:HTH-type transcriptional regulator EthR [Actinomadura rubteroloni]|uniref:HTH-type transcriptional regulator EthR n=1 Tax=Actinomadura rubteroloni TaxID=1926885 RepID=A0A2P4UN19_9ACTN|nr:TetR/AcrR family transcriptional regulator [Actinomadura rubteroloni]POM26441.1 HTH-type transcriptional regulator EthR [Actinomadura rubteroloni]
MTGRPYGGRDPQQRQRERRDRLLAAALELYGTAGYNPTTIADVCRTAGVAPAHFYELFGSREELLRVLYDEIVTTTFDAVLAAVADQSVDPAVRVRAGLTAYCDHLLTDPRRARVQCIEVVGVSAEMEAHRRAVIRQYAEFLAAELNAINDRRPNPAEPDPASDALLATAVVGGVNEAMIDWLLLDERPPVSALLSGLTLMLTAVADARLNP